MPGSLPPVFGPQGPSLPGDIPEDKLTPRSLPDAADLPEKPSKGSLEITEHVILLALGVKIANLKENLHLLSHVACAPIASVQNQLRQTPRS